MIDEYEQQGPKKQGPSVLGANTIFFLVMLFLFGFDVLVKVKNNPIDMKSFFTLAMEFVFILLPSLIYVLIKGGDIRRVLRLNPLSPANALIVFGIVIFSIPLTGFVNYYVHILITHMGRPIPRTLPEINNYKEWLVSLLVIAGSPAICEEIMCRGVLMRGYEKYGKTVAIIISAILFSSLHRNIESLAGIFLIGLILGYVVYVTNSIFAGMIVHFTNNAIAVSVAYWLNIFAKMMGTDLQTLENTGTPPMPFYAVVFFIFVVLFSLIVFMGLITLLKSNTSAVTKIDDIHEHEAEKVNFRYFVPLILGLLMIGLELTYQFYYIFSLILPEWLRLWFK